MISVEEAVRHILEHRPARRIINIPLQEAAGYTLAEDVVAKVSKPPLPVSAMDGYAVRLSDVKQSGARLKLIGEAPTGRPFQGHVSEGETVRIFTGGAVPAGADHIVIQENVVRTGNMIECQTSHEESLHIRRAGLDFEAGETVLAAGRQLSPVDISIAAAANHDVVSVYQPLKVALLSNGNELKPPGSALGPGDIICSNPSGLGALLREWGAEPQELGIAKDSLVDIERKISSATEPCDVFVAIGGASVGDHDHMRRAFQNAGFSLIFEKIAVRPGKPTWLAQRGEQIVLGLPGNPASALVCAHLFLRPLVHDCDSLRFLSARAAASMSANGGRETYMRAIASVSASAVLDAQPLPLQDSSLLSPFLRANCLIRRTPHQAAIEVEDVLEVYMIGAISSA